MKRVERSADMVAGGLLRLEQTHTGEITVAVQSARLGILQPGDSVQFSPIGEGGGRSPKTMAALRQLITAMEDDNAAYPFADPNYGHRHGGAE